MTDKIEVYVRTEKIIVGQYTSEPISDGVIKHDCLSKKVMEYEMRMPETDSEALRIVKDLARKKGVRVEVHDVSKLKDRLNAARKGIGKTPVIVVGKNRIEGESAPELLESKLRTYAAEQITRA
jgi:hypothetical protein